MTFPPTAASCRVFWPPDAGGAGCDCTACVTADSHNKGTLTIQQAIDRAQNGGGVRVCLEPGTYVLGPAPLLIRGLSGLRLSGHGAATVLLYSGPGPAIEVDGSKEVTLEDFLLFVPRNPANTAAAAAGFISTAGALLSNSRGVTVQRCRFIQPGPAAAPAGLAAAIALRGYLLWTVTRECTFYGAAGVGSLAVIARLDQERIAARGFAYLLTAGLDILDNFFFCGQWGVRLDGFTLHHDATRIAGNVVYTSAGAGIIVAGQVTPDSRLDVAGNKVRAGGDGIRVGTSDTRVGDNDVSPAASAKSGDGIVLAAGLDPSGLARCQVLGNRIQGVIGNGVGVRTHVVSAMIKQNFIERAGSSGIVVEDSGSADVLSIANNQVLNVGGQANPKLPLAGIQVFRAARVEIVSNVVQGVGVAQNGPTLGAGILVIASAASAPAAAPADAAAASAVARTAVRIAGNVVTDVGPPVAFEVDGGAGYGIQVWATFDRLEVVENAIRRFHGLPPPRSVTGWTALQVFGAGSAKALVGPAMAFVPQEGRNTVGYLGGRFLQLPPGAENLSARGNRLDAYGLGPGTAIVVLGSCVFAENQCELDSPNGDSYSVVGIEAGAIVAGQNIVKYVHGDVAITKAPVMDLHTQEKSITVLGNITNGVIHWNDHPLPNPWGPLNVITAPLP